MWRNVKYVEIKCQLDATDDFYCRSYCLLNMFQAPLCPSSGAREYYTDGCCLWYLVLWFSSCRYGVELRVMYPVCGLLQQPANRTHNPISEGLLRNIAVYNSQNTAQNWAAVCGVQYSLLCFISTFHWRCHKIIFSFHFLSVVGIKIT